MAGRIARTALIQGDEMREPNLGTTTDEELGRHVRALLAKATIRGNGGQDRRIVVVPGDQPDPSAGLGLFCTPWSNFWWCLVPDRPETPEAEG